MSLVNNNSMEPFQTSGLRLYPDGKMVRILEDEQEVPVPPEEEERVFLSMCGYFHAYKHRWGFVNGLYVGEDNPPILIGNLIYSCGGINQIEGKLSLNGPHRFVHYSIWGSRHWRLFIVEMGDMSLYVRGAFLSGFRSWREAVDIYNEFTKFFEMARDRKYEVLWPR